MPANPTLLVHSETEMRDLGARLIAACDRGGVITLKGELGTGKTTLVRGALEAEGITGGVRSPTYTLVEYYPLERFAVAHFDLYRLAEAEELEYLGYRDYLNSATLCFIEWPQRAGDYLQAIDLEIRIDYDPQGRSVCLSPKTDWGHKLVSGLIQAVYS